MTCQYNVGNSGMVNSAALTEQAEPASKTFGSTRFAFTLAEVLITLGIIGIIAALTMPALISDYKEKATVAKLKKVYSIFSQVMLQAQAEHG
ncbi:MAG: prepilin-type N-terminal cleavage/methylation domain-containing protein, partial [Heliobacteriaceae bacterium]|nr:prepilin-type N-terminal cleavage/methylation domain-containing protein [Heliobacteriaceae bacterium]